MELNRNCLIKLIGYLQYLGRQGEALRENDEEHSNFIQRCTKDFLFLIKCMEKKTNRYLSHEIQNEIL